MQHEQKVAKLMEWFSKAALCHAEAIEAMQEETASVQVAELDRFYAAIKREEGVELFLSLLSDENDAVAGMAAVYAMREAPARCMQVLRRLADLPGLTGFRAQVALERWEAGEWPPER